MISNYLVSEAWDQEERRGEEEDHERGAGLTNEKRALRQLTNERRVLPGPASALR